MPRVDTSTPIFTSTPNAAKFIMSSPAGADPRGVPGWFDIDTGEFPIYADAVRASALPPLMTDPALANRHDGRCEGAVAPGGEAQRCGCIERANEAFDREIGESGE